MRSLLTKLNIEEVNVGVCTGSDGWIETDGPLLTSGNPTNNEPIGTIQPDDGRQPGSDTWRAYRRRQINTINWSLWLRELNLVNE